MTRKLLTALLFLCVFLGAVCGADDFFKGLEHLKGKIKVGSKIAKIEISGNSFVANKAIEDSVFSRAGDEITEAKILSDIKSIYSLGYFSDVSVDLKNTASGTDIIYKVAENPIVADIKIEGNTAITTEEIKLIMQTKRGWILNYKDLQKDIKTINQYYVDAGYILAKVTDASMAADNRTLAIKIEEGIIESIELSGNKNTKDYVILREMKNRPGTIVNERTLSRDLRGVFNLGFFSEVTPRFDPGSKPGYVNMTLDMKETNSGNIQFGGGYGEREGFFGMIDLTLNNLMGTGRAMTARGQFGQELSTYQFKYREPWLLPDRLGDNTSFTFKRWYTIGRDIFVSLQDQINNGWDTEFSKPLYGDLYGSVILGSENVSPYKTATFEQYVSDSITLALSYDTRDYWMNPNRGSFYSLSLKEGWKLAASGAHSGFVKYGLELNQFIPVAATAGQVLAGHIGFGVGFGDVPLSELYYAGGANSVRGYYPQDAHRGTRKMIANLEYRYTFNETFQGVFFFDWGDAWDQGFLHTSQFLTGWGPGVRVNTPLGPIRLDYGIPSGVNFGQGIIHFSIGQAF